MILVTFVDPPIKAIYHFILKHHYLTPQFGVYVFEYLNYCEMLRVWLGVVIFSIKLQCI